ncbi:polysaccharide biosynthesis C-terminal domain-containing protein [bacterium]|nr:polysaccharide biosynthesis C-terminal domain-containing protein [bacterium]
MVTKKFVRFGIEFDVGFIKNVLCEAWPFAIMVICGTIYFSIDIMLLSYFKDDYSVGIYSACVDIYKAAVIPSAIVCTALFPRLSIKAHIGGEGYTKILKKLVILQVLLGSLIAIMICIFAHHAIMILYGKGFEESIGYLRVILVLVPIRYLNFIVGDSLSALNIQRKRMWAIFICMVFNFTTNLYFIPLYGIAGAIGTTIATECLLAGQYWFYTLKTVQRKRIV